MSFKSVLEVVHRRMVEREEMGHEARMDRDRLDKANGKAKAE